MSELLHSWLEEKVGYEFFRGGFERIQEVLAPYKHKIERSGAKIVTIAGTNGKGQTSFNLETLCLEAQLSCALWTSPHILSVTERFRFNGQPLAEEELMKTFESVYERYGRTLSYYEFLLVCFCERLVIVPDGPALDIIIFEVGLGGRYDAVNVFDASVSAITSISLDHQAYLGDSLAEIFAQKWGVTRNNQVCHTSLEQADLRALGKAWALRDGVVLIDHWRVDRDYQLLNSQLAVALFKSLDQRRFNEFFQDSERVIEWLARDCNHGPGRHEIMTSKGNRFTFIGAHNCDGLRKMVGLFETLGRDTFNQVWFSFSQRETQDLMEATNFLIEAKSWGQEWIFCQFDHPKALTGEQLEAEVELAERLRVLSESLQNRAEVLLERLLKVGESKKDILITGSYYFISNVQTILRHFNKSDRCLDSHDEGPCR
jgi:dihydrofolate synthase / folylpolyglutamate synthase